MTQYRDNMTLAELEAFMHSLNELDAAYAAADAAAQLLPQPEDDEARDAAYEQSMEHLNRIAGDR